VPDIKHNFRFVDLFAGLGGFHVALSELGGTAVFAAEWEARLNRLYEKNFGIRPWTDVNDLDPTAIPDHEVLTAGFPCQPFSKAGEQLGFAHTLQGQLFFKVRDILQAKLPSMFILENVPNILRHQNGETLRTMLGELRGLGYDVAITRLSPHQFGIPQVRDRAYIVGSKSGLSDFAWPAAESVTTDIRSVLSSESVPTRPVPAQTLRAIDIWGDFLKSAPADVKLPSFPIWAMEFGATYPYETETPAALLAELGPEALNAHKGSFGRSLGGLGTNEVLEALPSHGRRLEYEFPSWKKSFIRQNRDFYAANSHWIDPWLKRSRIEQLPSSFQKFEWNAQGGQRDIEEYVIQARASGIRVKRTTTAPSLIAMTTSQVPIIGWERRYMTPLECAQLQSLGSIELPELDLHAYKALGNAVNARVVQRIAKQLIDCTLGLGHTGARLAAEPLEMAA
jgi:DNA (cytosine-5)-methyltransferase 1